MQNTNPNPESGPGSAQKNLDAAEGKTPSGNHVHNAGAADEIPGEFTASGQYGLPEAEADSEDFYSATKKGVDDPEAENLK